ncbi:hypothetical protein BDN72DRAFT_896716 [Pluteus cervinus]|uniref:Uncharacterized protein n=1 Tax=Pluteus cervinus TaxID=181527 RepID=A0ACD3AWF5_9AGAR|nr:hypothetical protein BDN72DRAFT_896716 [Pluteus cervinus]
MSALPFDILPIIASSLPHNPTSLKAACLVSHQWKLAFQPALFFGVHINNEVASNKFLAVIQTHPPFASLVRSLELQFTGGPINTIFMKLPLLQSLTISHRRALPPKLCTALRLTLGSKHITSLTLQDVKSFPLQILSEIVGLKHFSSIGSSYCGRERALAKPIDYYLLIQQHTTGSQLRSLSLSSMGPDKHELLQYLIHPKCVIDLRDVKHLTFHSDPQLDHTMFCSLVSMIPSTLEHLTYRAPKQPTVGVNGMGLQLLNDFRLSRFTHLQSFELYTYLNTTHDFTEIDLSPWSTAFIANLSTPSRLESLEIRCSWNYITSKYAPTAPASARRLGFTSVPDAARQRWDDLDSFLSSKAFPMLKVVSFYVASIDIDSPKDVMAIKLPRLEKEGKLRVVMLSEGV